MRVAHTQQGAVSIHANRGLVYEALLECVSEDIPVNDEMIKGWSKYVTQYLNDKGFAITSHRGSS
jgi:hypothetical protein